MKDGPLLRSSRLIRAIVLGAAAFVLAWLVISKSLVAYLAINAPEVALRLRPDDPEALLSLAEKHLDPARSGEPRKPPAMPATASAQDGTLEASGRAGDGLRVWAELAKDLGKTKQGRDPERPSIATEAPPSSSAAPATLDHVRIWAETALVSDPLNARALRILGQLAHATGDRSRAVHYMQAAARRSIQESVAVHWLMRYNSEKKDYAAALYFADALSRTSSKAMPHVLPTLSSIAENPEARGELEKLLANNPPWRRAFLSALPGAVSDARTPLLLLLAIRGAPNPPTVADIRDYVNLLLAHKFYELAYYTWLQFLPPEQLSSAGFLFNGRFEFAPSGLPFDWEMSAGTGVTIDIVQRSDQAHQRALFIELGPGRVEFSGVAQTLLLAPGTYQFRGKYRGEIIGRRGLVWRVTCAGGTGVPIGQSSMMVGVATPWKDVEFSFTVHRTECRAQRLRLELDARMASEQLVSGSVWYDELRISRDN